MVQEGMLSQWSISLRGGLFVLLYRPSAINIVKAIHMPHFLRSSSYNCFGLYTWEARMFLLELLTLTILYNVYIYLCISYVFTLAVYSNHA